MAVEWAAAEGWNPGLHDPACFSTADPAGFVGVWRGEPVACISAVAQRRTLRLHRPLHRETRVPRKGFGIRTWQPACYLGDRNISPMGRGPAGEHRKSGFELAYRNIRWRGARGRHRCARGGSGRRALEQLPRSPVLSVGARGSSPPGSRAAGCRCARDDRRRPCRRLRCRARRCRTAARSARFSPTTRASPLVPYALAARMPGEVIVLDVPETNPAAVALAERHGMTSVFETARMYTKDAPAMAIDRVFGVTSFELG